MTKHLTPVPLKTTSDIRQQEIVEHVGNLLEDAKAGDVRQIFIVWENGDRIFKQISFSHSRWELMGIVQTALYGLAMKQDEGE